MSVHVSPFTSLETSLCFLNRWETDNGDVCVALAEVKMVVRRESAFLTDLVEKRNKEDEEQKEKAQKWRRAGGLMSNNP